MQKLEALISSFFSSNCSSCSFSLEFPVGAAATRVNEAFGDLSNAALTAPNNPWLYLLESPCILITAIGFPDRLASDLLSSLILFSSLDAGSALRVPKPFPYDSL